MKKESGKNSLTELLQTQLVSLLNSGGIAFFLADPSLLEIQLSSQAASTVGLSTGDLSVFQSYIDPSDLPDHQRTLKHALINREEYTICYKYHSPNGRLIHLEEKGKAITGSNGQLHGIFGTYTDITEKIQLQEELKIALAMAKFPMENPNPVFRVDYTGRVLYANNSSTALLKKLGIKNGVIVDPFFIEHLKSSLKGETTRQLTLKVDANMTFAINIVQNVAEGYANIYVSDITELEELQKRMLQTVADLRAALNSTDDVMILLDDKLHILQFNINASDLFKQLFNHPLQPNTLLSEYMDPQLFCIFEERYNTVIDKGGKIEFEFDMQPFVKRKLWFNVLINAVYEENSNQSIGACISLKDITESKSELLQLETQKEFYETILDNIPADIAIFDHEHRYVYVNPQGIKDVNLRAWMIGKTDYDYCKFKGISTSLADERKDLFQRVLSSKSEHQIESEHVLPNGELKYVIRKFYPYYLNGNFKLMIGYGVDITETKRAHKSLLQSEHRYRTLFENNPLMAFILDKASNIISVNASVFKELDYSEHQLFEHPLINIFPEINRDDMAAKINRCFEEPDQEFGFETRMAKLSGKLIDAEIRAKVIYSEKGVAQLLLICNNITLRKQNERLLEESEKLNRRLIQELPLPVGIIQGTEVILSNEAYQQLLEKNNVDVNYNFIDFIIEEDKPELIKANEILLKGNESVDYQVRISPEQGKIKYVDVRDSLFNYKNQLVTLSLMNDITDRVLMEKKNKEIEERTRHIIDSALDAIIITDLFGKMVDWNKQAQSIFGYTYEEVSKRKLEDIILPENPNQNSINPAFNKVKFVLNQLIETFGLNSAGVKFPIELFIAQIETPEQKLLSFYIRDISVRKNAELKIQETERIENILTNFSADCHAIETIPGVLEMLVSTTHAIFETCDITVFLTDTTGKQLLKFHQNNIKNEQNDSTLRYNFTEGIVGKAASEKIYLFENSNSDSAALENINRLGAPIIINDHTYAVVLFETTSENFHTEFNLNIIRKIFEFTTSRIAKIIDEQNQLKLTRELVRNNAQLQQYSYIVSHNLRAPIANLLGLSKIFNQKDPADNRNRMIIQNIESSANNIDNVLKDLNEILSIKKDLNKSKEYVLFEDVLSTVLKGLEAELHHIRPVLTFDLDVLGMMSIKPYITSIFSNLLANSLKYRANGRDCIITVRSWESDIATILEFEDNGIGIDLSRHGEKIFGLYKRFHMHVEGTGIGLHLVKSQVEALGGHITISSQVDKGTKFKIEIYHE